MPEPFEIIDPLERFVEAREAVAPGTEPTRQGWQIRTNQALWLAGAAVFAISTLILVNTLSPRIGGEFASQLHKQSAPDTASQPHVSSPAPPSDPQALTPAPPPPAQAVHAIEPEATADQSSEGQFQPSQKPQPLSTLTSGQFAESNSEQPNQVISEADNEDMQWVKTSLAAKAHSGPSVSSPILTYYPLGTELRMTSRQNGWVQIIDPATSQQGWIYEIYLSPSEGPGQGQDALPQQPQSPISEQPPTQAELDMPDESGISAPDPSTPAAKSNERKYHGSNRHHARRGIVIRFGFRRFRF